MQVVYVKRPFQNADTKNPQIIDGKVLHWRPAKMKLRGTLQEEIQNLVDIGETEYLLIHNIESCPKYFCDQGCAPGQGCKKEYREDDHAVILTCFRIPKVFEDTYADTKKSRYVVELSDKEYNLIGRYPITKDLIPYRNERGGVNSEGWLFHEFEDYKRTLVFGIDTHMSHKEIQEGLGDLVIPFEHLNPHYVKTIDLEVYDHSKLKKHNENNLR